MPIFKFYLKNFKKFLIGGALIAWVFLVLDHAIVMSNIKSGGTYPIGENAVYLEGGSCTVNLTAGSFTDYCFFKMPLSTQSQDFIPEINECIKGRTDLPGYVLPSLNKCLSLHEKFRLKYNYQ